MELLLDSNESVTGSFRIVAVEYEGAKDASVTLAGDLFDLEVKDDCFSSK